MQRVVFLFYMQAKSERCIFSAKCRDVGEEHIQIAAGILKIYRFSIGDALNLILISRLDSPCPGFCILTVQSEWQALSSEVRNIRYYIYHNICGRCRAPSV